MRDFEHYLLDRAASIAFLYYLRTEVWHGSDLQRVEHCSTLISAIAKLPAPEQSDALAHLGARLDQIPTDARPVIFHHLVTLGESLDARERVDTVIALSRRIHLLDAYDRLRAFTRLAEATIELPIESRMSNWPWLVSAVKFLSSSDHAESLLLCLEHTSKLAEHDQLTAVRLLISTVKELAAPLQRQIFTAMHPHIHGFKPSMQSELRALLAKELDICAEVDLA